MEDKIDNKKKYFWAVNKGRIRGIFLSWADASAQVIGYSGSCYKKFDDLQSAQKFAGVSTVYQIGWSTRRKRKKETDIDTLEKISLSIEKIRKEFDKLALMQKEFTDKFKKRNDDENIENNEDEDNEDKDNESNDNEGEDSESKIK